VVCPRNVSLELAPVSGSSNGTFFSRVKSFLYDKFVGFYRIFMGKSSDSGDVDSKVL
jgi:hypothetical protein